MMGKMKLVDLEGEVRNETPLAILFYDGKKSEWLSKNLVEINQDGTITMPEWLALDKGLI
jgi:hypothetical protein